MKTNVSPSSIEIYHWLKESGELSERRLQVVEVLSRMANVSCHYICRQINKQHPNTFPSSVSGRLNELVEMGIVEQSLDRSKCEVTGNMVHKYALVLPALEKVA